MSYSITYDLINNPSFLKCIPKGFSKTSSKQIKDSLNLQCLYAHFVSSKVFF